jgi:hypothetical protein
MFRKRINKKAKRISREESARVAANKPGQGTPLSMLPSEQRLKLRPFSSAARASTL